MVGRKEGRKGGREEGRKDKLEKEIQATNKTMKKESVRKCKSTDFL